MAYASVDSIARQFSKNSIITHCVDMSSQSQRIKQKYVEDINIMWIHSSCEAAVSQWIRNVLVLVIVELS